MNHKTESLLGLSLALLLSCAGAIGAQDREVRARVGSTEPVSDVGAELPILDQGHPEAAADLRVTASCSATEPGLAEAIFSWRSPVGAERQHRLDLTSYRNGFELGEFRTFWSPRPDLREAEPVAAYRPPPPVYDEETGEMVSPGDEREEKGRITVVLTGLDPGGNDYWRVLTPVEGGWAPSATARVEVPVCPVDRGGERKPEIQ